MLVKICGITSEADALLAVGLGADALGFVFAPSPRQVAAQAVRRIVERVPAHILTVGVFRNEARTRVVDIVNGIGLRGAQLHGNETPDDTQWVAARVPVTIKAFPAGHRNISRLEEYGADVVLVDAQSPGSGEVFDWRLAEGVADTTRLIVSGGLNPANVGDAIAHLRPYGVDVSSGVEAEPGKKDPHAVRAFVAAARTAAAAVAAEQEGVSADDDLDRDDHVEAAGTGVRGGAPFDWESDV
ncbi:MAG TPA: phosphoribosylanthranilate isomerase [Acidimicrobiales bacterium]|nr:phosphoribosylanthranilate isomerase [Acidimicrobiales bacterium]